VPGLDLLITRRFYKPSDEKPVLELLARPGYENLVRWVPDTPGHELPAVVRQAAIGLSPLQDVGQYRVAVPSKFFDYMAESCAILASDLPPSRKYVAEVGCGLLAPPADVDAWADAMVALLADPQRTRALGRVGRAAFLERFNWEAYEPAFIRFYDELAQVKR
jgi:glycosyltransferase involved in cell wall biosynthesis